ncbi:hypothetical protein Ga0609869_001005 [Rhodovulum iodosum]|uniref:F5/8 type C domain-containing protein n=1 Tax=Rhodovulum iodosum TaxID=68291 RepID=A0ABV3XQS5_9RHOB|nr:hypothetical protein [Rhodovulum robiginosum]RSK32919.1 hypothetical protein EJA01_11400 [Rhodovulum robiginosum]
MPGYFEDFVRRICDEQGLVDIGPEGRASQSSFSKWSRKEDAQRAVTDIGQADFAFHTEREAGAWWRLDFESTHFPDLICIENRGREAFWDLASRVRVKVSADGEDWTTLHEGNLFFGSFQNGTPLLLPLGGRLAVRSILVENDPQAYFHLRSVKVFARKLHVPAGKPVTFVSNRTDGLGERLKALVNCIALSEYYDGDFAFAWKPISNSVSDQHAIGKPQDIFSQAFIGKHLSEQTPDKTLKDFLKGTSRGQGRGAKAHSHPVVIDVPQRSIYSFEPQLESVISRKHLSEAFSKIEFSEKMEKAAELARSVDIPAGSIGMHLRAGDIIFGRYRYNARYLNKVVPYPIALRFVQKQNEFGRKVALFGQDQELCKAIEASHDAVFAGGYHAEYGFDNHQAALFDIVLMSRCATVVAGNSGFSQIAQIIGMFETIEPTKIFQPEEAVGAILEELSPGGAKLEAHDFQKAFACSYALNMFPNQVSELEAISLMQLACRMDPDNAFYFMLLAILNFRIGNIDASQEILETLIDEDSQKSSFGSLWNLVSTIHPDGSFAIDRQVRALTEMAEQGVPAASGILALFHKLKGDTKNAGRHLDRFLTSHTHTASDYVEKLRGQG